MTEIENPRRPGWVLKGLATIVTLANIVLGLIGGALSAIGLGVLYYALGHAVALFLVVLFVVVLF